MNKPIETYLASNFIDYKNQMHPFVICAISIPASTKDFTTEAVTISKDKDIINECDIERIVSIGYAICNPIDKFDEEIGRKLAKERALSGNKIIFSSNAGIINHTMIEGLLKQEENFIKTNPGAFIKGYTAAKKQYLQKQSQKKKEYIVNEKTLRQIIDFISNHSTNNDIDVIINKIFK